MRKIIRIIVSAVLCISFVSGMNAVCFTASGEGVSSAELNNVYGDGMLFQQKEDVIIAGNAASGAEIICEVRNSGGNVTVKTKDYANKKGGFTVRFKAPAGGYENFTLTFYENGVAFRTLNDVAFGELWLSSGQSNMQYPFVQSSTYEQNSVRSEWLRFLYVDPYVKYNGDSEKFPLEPQNDIEDGCCRWYKGTDNIDAVSAVSFYFAQELEKKLNMPVGVLMPNLGGSMLHTWLSRDTIDGSPRFADYINSKGNYISVQEWDKSKIDWYSTVTANYNKKIYPLRNFRVSGMIWYQGESEIFADWDKGFYKTALELLQDSYSELFGFEGEKMPFVTTQVASYAYGQSDFGIHNNEFIDFQRDDPKSRAVAAIYDIDLDFLKQCGSVHPAVKQPVGERMAACAYGLVYGGKCSTAATVSGFRVDGNDFYVTFNDVGDGLYIDGENAVGFSLAQEGGIYVQADAEIVNENTLRIFSDEVENPVSAAYAFAENNNKSNVYSTCDGEKFLPIAPFDTDINGGGLSWEIPAWADCGSEEAFFLSTDDNFAGLHKTWEAENAEITFSVDDAYKGGCLNIVSSASAKRFSVSPVYTFMKGGKIRYFDRMLRDWRNYSSVSVMVRNNGGRDVELNSMKIYVNSVTWFAPEVNGCGEANTVIPADGQWHKLTFDLNRIYLFGNECGAVYSRRKLGDINGFRLCFKGADSDISVDDFRFTGDASDGSGIMFENCLRKADNPWEFLCGIFTSLFGIAAGLFSK